MRDRVLTPFFSLDMVGPEISLCDVESPNVSARALEGALVNNGRYLLVEKTDHTEDSARYTAKDMVGGIDVELEVHRCARRGIRVGRSDTAEHKALPDLLAELSQPPTRPAAPPVARARLRGALQRARQLFSRKAR